jgi:valyl-tRNA synthetase
MDRVESNRNFVNKLWNAGKYLQNVLSSVSAEEIEVLRNKGPVTAEEMVYI